GARPVIEHSLAEAFGPRWRDELEPSLADGLRTRAPLGRVLLTFVFRPRSVERRRNISYGPAGRAHTLDLYRHRSHSENAPVLLYFHGGGYSVGFKSFESRALLFRLASCGWV